MSVRHAARVLACMVCAVLLAGLPVRAEEGAPVDEAAALVIKTYQVADLVVPFASTEAGKGEVEFDWLLDLIELRTGAECWTHGGGQGAVTPHEPTLMLVIRQTRAMHERIADLLSELRGTGDLALCVEIQFVHGDLEGCSDARPHRTAQGLVDAAGKQRLVKLAQSQPESRIWFAPKITFFNGQSGTIEHSGDLGTTKVSVRGVVSGDNRYARLWLDALIDDQSSSAEVLVPEGYTAVRRLPGENRWLLVTSHVINAEEPQVFAPVKSPAVDDPAKKRYLVPVDETPDPTELTGVPRFRAEAESFGLAVRKAQQAGEEGIETAAASLDAEPELVQALECAEYQVAQAEPRPLPCSVTAPPPPMSVSFFENEVTSTGWRPERTSSGDRIFGSCDGESPFRLWIGDLLMDEEPHVAGLEVVHVTDEPPARLDVCLSDSECQPSSGAPAVAGRMFDRVFVTPLPTFPVDDHGTLHPRLLHPPVTISHFEFGRRAILSRPRPGLCGEVVLNAQPAPGRVPPAGFAGNDLVFVPGPRVSKVEQVSGEEELAVTVESQLKAAAESLEKLGLESEARKVHAVRNMVRLRAAERCREIDLEIARLKAARQRLEKLSEETGR